MLLDVCIQAYLDTGGMCGKLVSGTLLISSRGIAPIASDTCLSIGRSEYTGASALRKPLLIEVRG